MGTRAITYIDPTTGLPTTIEAEDSDLFGCGLVGARPGSGDFTGDLWLLDDGAGRFILQRWSGAAWVDLTTAPSPSGTVDNRIARFDGTAGQIQNSGVSISDSDEVRMAGTLELDKGADIASAATLTLGVDGNYFDVTGTSTITAISAKPIGTRIVLQFDGVVTVTHNSTTLSLRDGRDLVTAAGYHLEFISYDGTNWMEIGRSIPQVLIITNPVKALSINNPSSSEDLTMFFTDRAITINHAAAVARGTTPSVTWQVRHHTDRSNAGNALLTSPQTTTGQTTGDQLTSGSFSDATIPANSWVWFETTGEGGTIDEFHLSLEYTED